MELYLIHYNNSAFAENYLKQKDWMRKYLCKWKGTRSGRDRASPHIKTYTRFAMSSPSNGNVSSSDDHGPESDAVLAWMLLTSSNMSRAAWGELQKKGAQFMIRSYELGVLIWPGLFKVSSIFACVI